MLAEVVIHLGSEWRDVGIFLVGCVFGTVVGIAFMDDKYQKHIREQQNK